MTVESSLLDSSISDEPTSCWQSRPTALLQWSCITDAEGGAVLPGEYPMRRSIVCGFGIVQQSLRLFGGVNFLHFDFVPSLDGGCVTAADFTVAEGEVTPADAVSACGCGVQKNGVIWGILRDQVDILRGNTRASSEEFGTPEVSMIPKVSSLDLNSSQNERTSFLCRRSSWRALRARVITRR